jgi:hypothetical protein
VLHEELLGIVCFAEVLFIDQLVDLHVAMELTDPDAMCLEVRLLVVFPEIGPPMQHPWYEMVEIQVVVCGATQLARRRLLRRVLHPVPISGTTVP